MYFVHIPYVTKQQQMRTPYCVNMCYAYNNKKELHNAVVILPFTFYIYIKYFSVCFTSILKRAFEVVLMMFHIFIHLAHYLQFLSKQIGVFYVRNCSQNFLSIFTFLIILKCLILNLMESSSFHHFLLFYALMKGIV